MQVNSTINETTNEASFAKVIHFKPRPSKWLEPESYETVFEHHLFKEKTLDLMQMLLPHPTSTFFVHVSDDCMHDAGILTHDILIVDSSHKCTDGDIIVGWLDGHLLLGTLITKNGRTFIHPANEKYAPSEILEPDKFQLGGLVLYAIHSVTDRLGQAF